MLCLDILDESNALRSARQTSVKCGCHVKHNKSQQNDQIKFSIQHWKQENYGTLKNCEAWQYMTMFGLSTANSKLIIPILSILSFGFFFPFSGSRGMSMSSMSKTDFHPGCPRRGSFEEDQHRGRIRGAPCQGPSLRDAMEGAIRWNMLKLWTFMDYGYLWMWDMWDGLIYDDICVAMMWMIFRGSKFHMCPLT